MHTRSVSTTSHRFAPKLVSRLTAKLTEQVIKRRLSGCCPGSLMPRAVAMLARAGLLGVMLASSSAQASDYLIEAIVFKWKSGPAVEETFSTEPGTSNVPSTPRATPKNLVQQVRPSLLVNAANGMQSAGAVDVLEHIGWTQSRAGQSGSPQMDMGAAAGSNLTGWVRLYTNTYLFAEIDLAMRDETGEMIRLKQRRRVKFNEVHYFDHPKFGVVVTISPNKS